MSLNDGILGQQQAVALREKARALNLDIEGAARLECLRLAAAMSGGNWKIALEIAEKMFAFVTGKDGGAH